MEDESLNSEVLDEVGNEMHEAAWESSSLNRTIIWIYDMGAGLITQKILDIIKILAT